MRCSKLCRQCAGIIAVVMVAIPLAGCLTNARVGVSQPATFVYRNTITPMTMKRDRRNPQNPTIIPDNLVIGKSTGYGLDLNPPVIGIPGPTPATGPAWGDMSLETAMRNGGMTELIYADAHVVEILGIFEKATIIAYGPPAEASSQSAEE